MRAQARVVHAKAVLTRMSPTALTRGRPARTSAGGVCATGRLLATVALALTPGVVRGRNLGRNTTGRTAVPSDGRGGSEALAALSSADAARRRRGAGGGVGSRGNRKLTSSSCSNDSPYDCYGYPCDWWDENHGNEPGCTFPAETAQLPAARVRWLLLAMATVANNQLICPFCLIDNCR